MVRELMHDPLFLGVRSETAGKEDLQTAQDLRDTLLAHRDTCVGMAANMIGVRKRIIAFQDGNAYTVMLNPEIVSGRGEYETEEGCVSLLGGPRKCKRFQTIQVQWQTTAFKPRSAVFTGWTAQIIQHEVDHCNGVLI